MEWNGEINVPGLQKSLLIIGVLQLLISSAEFGVGETLYAEVSSIGVVNVQLYVVTGKISLLGTYWAIFGTFIGGVCAVVGALMNKRGAVTIMIPVCVLGLCDAWGAAFIEGYYHLRPALMYTACATTAGAGRVTVDTLFTLGSPDLSTYGAAGDQQSAVQCMQSYVVGGDMSTADVTRCYCVAAGGGYCTQMIQTTGARNNLKHDCGFLINSVKGSKMSGFTILMAASVALSFVAGLIALFMVALGVKVLMTPPGDGAVEEGEDDGKEEGEGGGGEGTVVDPAATTKNAPTIELMEVAAPLPVASSPFADVRRGGGGGVKGFDKQTMRWAGGGGDTIPLPQAGAGKGKDALKQPLNIWANAPPPKDPGEV